MGRWTKRDPIGQRGGRNVYGFVENRTPYSWDYLGKAPVRPKILATCEKSLKDFIGRNSKIGGKFRFIDPGVRYQPAVEKPCEVTYECTCDCGDKEKGNAKIVSAKQHQGIRIVRTHVQVCVKDNYDRSRRWEMTFTHELQHASDNCSRKKYIHNCDKMYPGRTLSPGEMDKYRDCECASALCSEFRAYSLMNPTARPEVVARRLVDNGAYWSRGPGGAYCKDRGRNRGQVMDYLLRHCNANRDLLPPIRGINYTDPPPRWIGPEPDLWRSE